MSTPFLDALRAQGIDPDAQAAPPAQPAVAGTGDAPEAAPSAPSGEGPGLVRRVARDVGVGTAAGLYEAGRGALIGLRETAETVNSLVDNVAPTRDELRDRGYGRVTRNLLRPDYAVSDAFGAVAGALPETGTVTGSVFAGVGQFLAGNLLAGRALRVFGLANRGGVVGQQMARDAISGAVAFDPQEERLSNLLREHAGLRDPITAFLAARPDDNEAVARFRSALENSAIGGLTEGLFQSIRSIRAARNGNAAEAEAAARAAEDATPEGEVQRMVEETFTVRATQERWLRETVAATDEVRTRDTVTETTAERPAGTEAPRPQVEGLAPAGGDAMPQPTRITGADMDTLAAGIERARGNPAGIDRETAGVIWRNIDRMRSPEDGVAIVRSLEEAFERNYAAARGTVQNAAEQAAQAEQWARAAADIAVTNPRERDLLVQAMANDLRDSRAIGARALAYSALTTALQRRTGEWAEAVIAASQGRPFEAFGGNREALYAAFLRDANFLANVDPLTLGLRSSFGRNLRMLGEIVDGAAQGVDNAAAARPGDAAESTITSRTRTSSTQTQRRTIEQTIEGGERFVVEMAYRIRYARDPGSARNIAQRVFRGSSAGAMAGESWMNSLLSSPRTHVVGAVSSLVRTGYLPVERMVGGVIQGLSGDVRGAYATVREGMYQYLGMIQAVRESLDLAGRAFRAGDSIIDPIATSVETGPRAAITGANFGATQGTLKNFLLDGLGTLTRMPSRLLMTQDEFVKQLNYRGRVYAVAAREADDLGLSGAAARQHIGDRLRAAFDEQTGAPTSVDGLSVARRVTFTDEFGDGWLSQLGQGVQTLKARAPWLQVAVPFIRVPTNILRETVSSVPVLANFNREVRQELAAGGERAGQAWARMATGTAVALYATHLAMEGRITGSGPSNPQLRRELQAYGWQPNSIMVADDDGSIRFISYNRADPFGILFSVAATVAEVVRESSNETRDSRLDDTVSLMVAGVVKALASKTYLTGITQFAQAIADGDGRTQSVLQSLAATMVPAAARDLTQLGYDNEHMREAYTMAEAIRARLPGFSTLDPRRNALGEPVAVPGGWGLGVLPEDALAVLSPAAMRTVRGDDPVGRELLRMQLQHGSAFAPPGRNIDGVDLADFILPSGGTALGRLQALVGEVRIGGKTLRENLGELIASERYARATDGTVDIDGSRMQLVLQTFHGYHQAARAALFQEIPEVQQAVRARSQLRIDVLREGGDAVLERRGQTPSTPTLQRMLQNTP